MDTLSPQALGTLSQAALDDLALVVNSLDSLHAVALELNRRHSHASLQGRDQALHALDVIEGSDQLFDGWTGDMAVNWPAVYRARARAFGVIADHGMWDVVRTVGYSRADVETALESLAEQEGRARGFDHRPRVAVLVPEPDADAPF